MNEAFLTSLPQTKQICTSHRVTQQLQIVFGKWICYAEPRAVNWQRFLATMPLKKTNVIAHSALRKRQTQKLLWRHRPHEQSWTLTQMGLMLISPHLIPKACHPNFKYCSINLGRGLRLIRLLS